jgi:hypothetical protein
MRFREGFIIAAVVFCTHITFSQITSFPYLETFDSAQALALPSGWLTSTNKLISGDFRIEATSSAKSAPQCLLSSDAKTAQWLLSPEFDFRGRVPERLEFYERRSSTHTSGVLLDVLPNNDSLHPLLLADTMKLITASSYVK